MGESRGVRRVGALGGEDLLAGAERRGWLGIGTSFDLGPGFPALAMFVPLVIHRCRTELAIA